jgi:predicted aminopeptidase
MAGALRNQSKQVKQNKLITLAGSLLMLSMLLGLAGCEALGYYGQAASGQLYILTHKQDIGSMLKAADTPQDLKSRLQTIRQLLAFAETELQLPAAGQFNSYVDLQRPYVVWSVFAAPEFSIEPLSWCFPVAGCVPYRGYFQEAAALATRDKLQEQGLDVYVGGVSAYSTLGWFSDPVLSTIIEREPAQLASLLFHELAHQVAYASGDTEFNESFATAVEQAGLQHWIAATHGKTEGKAVLESLHAEELHRDQFVALVQGAVSDLEQLYLSAQPSSLMRELKQKRIERLRADYQQLQQHWDGQSPYEHWFAQPINNAQLATVMTYNRLVPAFVTILQRCQGRFPCFYAEAQRLARLSREARHAALATLL